MPEWNCLWSTSNSLVFIGIFQSEQKHQNKDQVSSNSLFKVEQMKGPNIKKKTSTWCVLLRRDKKLSCVFTTYKMSHGSQKEIEIWKSVDYWLWRTKKKQIQQNFYSCTIMAIIWENNGKINIDLYFPFMQ